MATGSDGKSCDVFLSDMKGDTSGTDMYNLGWEDEMIYSFGKGYTSKRGNSNLYDTFILSFVPGFYQPRFSS